MKEFYVSPGMEYELIKTVDKLDTAIHWGSGGMEVLATPALIAWMENTAWNAVASSLPEKYDTVGTHVDVAHLKATPVGMDVRVVAELTEAEGKQLTFKVKAYDEKDKIGEGIHVRYIVEKERFLQKVSEKQNS